ncbi:DUF1292 domain-containing protein [Mycoplasma zalophi]|uniref:DUF1292 domain-containing protein n=1 Tax=Mycoplasma zalophi TaxID=191287 RepID=A0ABS6DR39_9MOLU|nr:DUF1292 domain-containing protein [Mycoplasma zalophi]MBU4690772.1 DUF1292 domain-containing protein [Mycoplasma zalophi]MBU4692412.1 DUF1292 domain-containing protein [Mycoplasma zalophi]
MKINLNDITRKITIEDDNGQETEITILFDFEENGDTYLLGVLNDQETVVGLKKQNDIYVEIPEDEWDIVEEIFDDFLENNEIDAW